MQVCKSEGTGRPGSKCFSATYARGCVNQYRLLSVVFNSSDQYWCMCATQVQENFQLMDQIQQVLCYDLLSVPGLQGGDYHHIGIAAGHHTSNSSHAPAAAVQHHQAAQSSSITESLKLPDPAQLNEPGNSSLRSKFDINPYDQVWR